MALRAPDSLDVITRILAIPTKRTDHRLVGSFTRAEMDALLVAPDRTTRAGRRDHAVLLTLYNSGARVSEITALRRAQVSLGASASIQLHGKGRKERSVPLWTRTAVEAMPGMVQVKPALTGGEHRVPERAGGPLTRSNGDSVLLTAQSTGPHATTPPDLAEADVRPTSSDTRPRCTSSRLAST